MKTAELQDRELRRVICHKANNPDQITDPQANTLRRAQLTLHRWAELQCGTDSGHIEESPEGSGKYLYYPDRAGMVSRPWPIANREAGALKRIERVCKEAGLHYYHQTDPRGRALFVAKVPLNAQNYSSQGIACCV